MNDPRDEFGPYWLQTVTPFGAASEPPGSPAKQPWEYPLPHQALAAMWDPSKMPIPPARAPIFPPFPTSYSPIGRAPAWMDSAEPPEESRGILEQLLRRPVEQPPSDPWRQFPLPHQALSAMWGPSKLPIPPARAPIFPPFPTSYPPIGRAPAWMDSAEPPQESRGILGQLSRRPIEQPPPDDPWRQYLDPTKSAPSALPIPPALPPIFPPSPSRSNPYQDAPWPQMTSPFGSSFGPPALPARPVNQAWDSTDQAPAMSEPSTPPVPPAMPRSYSAPSMPSSWNPNSPSLWHRPVAGNAEFPAPAATDDDPFTRAARRTRQSVQPEGGRQPGFATALAQNLLPATAQAMATLPQRALTAAGDLQRNGDRYDPGPVLDTAMLMVGSPLTPRGALGSSARRLPMDAASREARARAMGYSDEPFYRGERTGRLPNEYPSGTYYSRDKSVAAEFARRGGQDQPREFRLNLTKALKDYEPVTAEQYSRVVASAAEREPQLAANMVDLIFPGKSVEWFRGYAKANPNFVLADTGAHIRQILKYSSDPVGILKGAGFNALDTGRDVQTLSGLGQRLSTARFDPAKAHWPDISASVLAGAPGAAWWLARRESQ
jgi:hypothetical protein